MFAFGKWKRLACESTHFQEDHNRFQAPEAIEDEVAGPKCVSALGVGSMAAINIAILGASGLLFRNALKSY